MVIPTLGITVPDHIAGVLQTHAGSDTGLNVIIVGQTYDNIQAQQYLAEVCRRAGDQAGVRTLGVEGTDAPIPAPASPSTAAPARAADSLDLRGDIKTLIAQGSQVSAGVLALQKTEPATFEVWGVDDMSRVRTSQGAMVRVMSNSATRDTAFRLIRVVLEQAQRKVYSPGLAALRSAAMPFAPERHSLSDRIAAIVREAGNLNVNLSAYPSIVEYDALRVWERKKNERRVAKQTAEFVRRVGRGVFGWFEHKGGNVININRRKLEPVLEYWWEKTGMTSAEYERLVAARGLEPALLELKRWLETWLAVQAKQASGEGTHTFYEELMRLALRLEIPYFDLGDFRESVARQRHVGAMRRNLSDEMNAAVRELCVKSQPPRGAELWELEERLDWLFRALALEVPANEAEVAEMSLHRLTAIVETLARIAGIAVDAQTRSGVQRLEDVLRAASEFLQLSWERGAVMARKTVERMEELGEDRALLVAGGFHMRAITHALQRTPDVSWSVVAPSPDLKELGGRRRLIG